MKNSLWVFFCLLTACEAKNGSSDEVICTLESIRAISTISVQNLSKGSDYLININGEFILNTCLEQSSQKLSSIEYLTSSENDDYFSLNLKSYILWNGIDNVTVEVTPTNENCEPLQDQKNVAVYYSGDVPYDECGRRLGDRIFQQPKPYCVQADQ